MTVHARGGVEHLYSKIPMLRGWDKKYLWYIMHTRCCTRVFRDMGCEALGKGTWTVNTKVSTAIICIWKTVVASNSPFLCLSSRHLRPETSAGHLFEKWDSDPYFYNWNGNKPKGTTDYIIHNHSMTASATICPIATYPLTTYLTTCPLHCMGLMVHTTFSWWFTAGESAREACVYLLHWRIWITFWSKIKHWMGCRITNFLLEEKVEISQ